MNISHHIRYFITRYHIYITLMILLSIFPSPSFGGMKLLEKRTPHFRFQYPPRWKNVAEYLWKRSEGDLQKMEETLGFQLNKELIVRLAPAGKEFSQIQPNHWRPAHWIAGLAYPQLKLMTIKIRPIDGLTGIHQTFQHELSHLLLGHASLHKRLPLWFVEGLAMIQSNDFGLLERFTMLAKARIFNKIPPIKTLTKRFPSDFHSTQLAYATSCDFLLFLQSINPQIIKGTLTKIRHGLSFQKALTSQTKWTYSELQKRWEESLSYRYSWLLLLANPSLFWSFLALLLLFAFLKQKQLRKKEFLAMDNNNPYQPPEFKPFLPSSPQLPDGQKLFPSQE